MKSINEINIKGTFSRFFLFADSFLLLEGTMENITLK